MILGHEWDFNFYILYSNNVNYSHKYILLWWVIYRIIPCPDAVGQSKI